MKKSKGYILMEVVVSIFILVFSLGYLVSLQIFTSRRISKQNAIINFVSICYEIDEYYSKYKSQWSSNYYSSDVITKIDDYYYVNYDNYFNAIKTGTSYQLIFFYNSENELIVRVNSSSGDNLIKEINYGGKRNV